MHAVPQVRAMLYKINYTRTCVSAVRKKYLKKKTLRVSWLVQDTLCNNGTFNKVAFGG